MRGHVDAETLAAFREELLPGRKTRQVAAHLAGCPRCAGLDAQLAGLPALLAHTPAPPMPDALTARIEAALAAEAAARSARSPAGIPGTEAATGASAPPAGLPPAGLPPAGPLRAGGGDGSARRSRRRWVTAPGRPRLALPIAVAATAVVVIVVGGYGVSRLLSGGLSGAGGSSAAGSPARQPAAGPVQGGAAGTQPAMGPANKTAGGSTGSYHGVQGSAPAYPVVTSGTNYRASQLKAQVTATLAQFPRAVPGPGNETTSPAPLAGGAAACLAGVTGGQRPRLVDVAHYEGKPATVVVVPAGARTLRVLVLSRHCPATGADLLNSTTLPSPG